MLGEALELAAWRQLAHTLPDADPAAAPLVLETHEIQGAPATLDSQARPPSPYAVTFPQGIVWAVLACAATFALSLVDERKRGTLMRLAVAPISRLHVLAGKGLACLLAIVSMELVLILVALTVFGVRPTSWGLLAAALASTALGFVGVMVLLAVLGRHTSSAAGLSWAILMVVAMLGGGMLPLFLMPPWLQTLAKASPVAWSISAIEGGMWRGYGAAEMLPPCLALVALGLGCLAVGARSLRRGF
jgi:ABC-2 type transport system permease protein